MLLRYPVARTTASMSIIRPSASSTLERKNLRTAGTTATSPDLIFPTAPMSKTGGAIGGRRRPSFCTLPRTSHDRSRRILSTSRNGSHFIRNAASSNSRTTMEGKAEWWARSRESSMPELPQPTTRTFFPRYSLPDL
ncbi:unnamed protein product [Spirodela intermedia]|uniref:Uncharacterized protein n=1 Tax=Spirodela intermedia TaxID=51605 RepID=A0A7I8IXK3_SPIIN|nr:unnamed protein product [Spirodela intermedia]CAA6662568.1 unnamed protein product [Spirodela intermedia]